MAKGQKPGMMLYHDDIKAIAQMDGEAFKAVILALAALSEDGVDEAPEGMAGLAYGFMAPKIKRDSQEYEQLIEKRQNAGKARMSKAQPSTSEHVVAHASTCKHMLAHASQQELEQELEQEQEQELELEQEPKQELEPEPKQELEPEREPESPPKQDTVVVIDTGDGGFGGGGIAAYLSGNLLPMSPGNWAALNEIMSQGISEALVRYAVDIATGNGKRTWGYVQGILNGWIVAGVRTVGEARAEHEARKRQGGPPGRMSAGAAFGELARKYAMEEAAERDKSGDGGDFERNIMRVSATPLGEL